MSAPEPRPPAGIGRRARAFWKAVTGRLELNEGEVTTLEQAVRVLSDIEDLQTAVATAPMVTTGSRGQEVVHPLRAELRNQRHLLSRLLAQLDLPDPSGEESSWDGLSASARSRKAARARWDHRGGAR